jgi:hypothetical protein
MTRAPDLPSLSTLAGQPETVQGCKELQEQEMPSIRLNLPALHFGCS